MNKLEPKINLKGCSKTAYGTCLIDPGLKICFDIGAFPEECVSCSLVLVTHGHTDHSGCLASHYRARRLIFNNVKTTYMMPSILIPYAKELLSVTYKLNTVDSGEWDENKINSDETPKDHYSGLFHPADIPYVYKDNDEYSLVINRFKVFHKQEHAVGYEVIKLIKRTQVSQSLVCYTGDTDVEIFKNKEFVTDTLIIECTFYDEKSLLHDMAKSHGHIHLKDISDNIDKLSNVKKLVLVHCSSRYKDQDIISNVAKYKELSKFQGELWILMPSGEFRLFELDK